MPGQPKPPGQRRRRNAGQTQWRTFAKPHTGAVPPLPTRRPGWLPSTRAFWRRLWRSPMASAYLEADLSALFRLAELVELQARGDLSGSGLSAMQALEDRFGLSPKSRQLLQWQVLAGGEAPAAPPPSSSGLPTSVRRLRAVDPQAASS